jgi:hypothetical protein
MDLNLDNADFNPSNANFNSNKMNLSVNNINFSGNTVNLKASNVNLNSNNAVSESNNLNYWEVTDADIAEARRGIKDYGTLLGAKSSAKTTHGGKNPPQPPASGGASPTK